MAKTWVLLMACSTTVLPQLSRGFMIGSGSNPLSSLLRRHMSGSISHVLHVTQSTSFPTSSSACGSEGLSGSSTEREHHLRIKKQLEAKELVRVRVSVSAEFRAVLRLPKKKKNGRIFMHPDDARSLDSLYSELEEHLGVPKHAFQVKSKTEYNSTVMDSDDDVLEAWDNDGGSGLSLLVARNPAVEWPPVPKYLKDMPDPASATAMQMLSFFHFCTIADPDETANSLALAWRPIGAIGRVYVSTEGVNAQMAVPLNVLENFRQACDSIPEIKGVDLNLDMAVSMAEFIECPPFNSLHVRPRQQLVSDGIDHSRSLQLEPERSGASLHPDKWHDALNDREAIVLDCRNSYESDLGRFEGAVPLETTTFRDTWSALKRVLEGKPKDTPVLTYCTGGIRCVKVGAYLMQEMGYTNVGRLEGGIINYTRHIRQISQSQNLPFANVTKFSGLNYVFNDRMAEYVTSNIPNPASSDRRAVEAKAIVARRIRRFGDSAKKIDKTRAFSTTVANSHDAQYHSDRLEEYSGKQSGTEPDLLAELRFTTEASMPNAGHMVSGHLQGRLLVMLSKLSGAKKVLEIGTFTGYSALCFAEAGSHVTTLEVDKKSADMAESFFARSPYPERFTLRRGAALETLDAMATEDKINGPGPFDVIFLDADKRKYTEYLDLLLGSEALVRSGTLILADNVLWKGRVLGLCTAGPSADSASDSSNYEEERSVRRDRILTQAMHEFNVKVRKDQRVEQVLLPLRDGLSLMRVL